MYLMDETTKVFININGCAQNGEPDVLIQFLHFVHETTERNAAGSRKLMELYEAIEVLKGNREMEEKYMSLESRRDDYEEKGRQEGRQEGELKNAVTVLMNILTRGTPYENALHLACDLCNMKADILDSAYRNSVNSEV